MRVIAGISKGVNLKSPSNSRVRPTSDRIRTVLFNMLGNLVIESHFLDLCAGTGSVGIEALSRGAKRAVFVELDGRCVETIKANLLLTKLFDKARIVKGDARRKLPQLLAEGERFDIVFLDPPYGGDLAIQLMTWLGSHLELLQGPKLVVLQQLAKEELPQRILGLSAFEQRRVGEHVLRFYSPTINWSDER
ncbi:MAG: 16S rRNA (guanine(966)-N(2))-methyltransferase RsmD [Armatimonadetes bacterium]|nr:16S rRNA (guanine(966)-N(2))-methyltransferase RsmD [Armatimonadota bacterium]MDW8027019.1 16S rRNA (guanine(966)-N(2))-methyltransferase RsmD [Armatimonadota bacterium]